MSKNTLRVYDTIAKKYVEAEVSGILTIMTSRSINIRFSSQPLSEALTEHLRTFTNL